MAFRLRARGELGQGASLCGPPRLLFLCRRRLERLEEKEGWPWPQPLLLLPPPLLFLLLLLRPERILPQETGAWPWPQPRLLLVSLLLPFLLLLRRSERILLQERGGSPWPQPQLLLLFLPLLRRRSPTAP